MTLYFLLLQSIELPDVQRLSWRQGRFAVVAVFHLAASKSGGIHTNSNPYHPHFANDYEHLKKNQLSIIPPLYVSHADIPSQTIYTMPSKIFQLISNIQAKTPH